jgi:hypothetical protein
MRPAGAKRPPGRHLLASPPPPARPSPAHASRPAAIQRRIPIWKPVPPAWRQTTSRTSPSRQPTSAGPQQPGQMATNDQQDVTYSPAHGQPPDPARSDGDKRPAGRHLLASRARRRTSSAPAGDQSPRRAALLVNPCHPASPLATNDQQSVSFSPAHARARPPPPDDLLASFTPDAPAPGRLCRQPPRRRRRVDGVTTASVVRSLTDVSG